MSKHFDPRKVLKQVSNPLLREFFTRRGQLQVVAWDTLSETEMDPVFEAWQQLPEAQRKEVQVVLQDVNELGDERGLRVLSESIQGWCPEKMAQFTAITGRCDKALWVYLNDHDAFDQAAVFARADALASGRYWAKRNGLPPRPLVVTDQMKQDLKAALAGYYDSTEGRGRYCHVEHYPRGNGSEYFFTYMDDYPDNHLVFDDAGRMCKMPERGAFTNVFVYGSTDGTLEMFARGGRQVQGPLQVLFCKAVLGIDVDPSSPIRPAYQLDGLKDRTFPLPTEPADQIDEVQVRRLRLSVVGSPRDRIVIEARPDAGGGHIYDLMERYLDARNLPMSRVTVTQATITLKFLSDGQHKPKTMTFDVGAPDSCNLKSKPEEQRIIGERCLRLWGITQ